MASLQDRVADQVNLAIERAAKKIYRQNVKLSPDEVAHLIEIHLQRLLEEKTSYRGMIHKPKTIAYQLAHEAVSDVDCIKKLDT